MPELPWHWAWATLEGGSSGGGESLGAPVDRDAPSLNTNVP